MRFWFTFNIFKLVFCSVSPTFRFELIIQRPFGFVIKFSSSRLRQFLESFCIFLIQGTGESKLTLESAGEATISKASQNKKKVFEFRVQDANTFCPELILENKQTEKKR